MRAVAVEGEFEAVGLFVEGGDEATKQPGGRRAEDTQPELLDVAGAGVVAGPLHAQGMTVMDSVGQAKFGCIGRFSF